MTSATQLLVGNTVLAAATGCVAWAVLRIGRRPVAAHLLFLIAIVKLMTPALIPVPVSTAPDNRVVTTSGSGPPGQVADVDSETSGQQPASVESIDGERADDNDQEFRSSPHPAFTGSWKSLLGLGWVAGSLLVVVTMWRRSRAFRRATRVLRSAPEWLTEMATALLPRFCLRRGPELQVVDSSIPPAVYATRGRLRMLFPARLLDELSVVEVRTLLAHELAHIRRRDHWIRVLEVLATAALWWHPLLWWLRLGLREAEERSCDAWVAAVLPDCRKAYCRALLHVAATDAWATVPEFASPARRLRNWKNRLEEIVYRQIPHRLSRVARMAALTLSIAVLPIALAQEPVDRTDANERLNVVVETKITEATVDDWTSWLARVTDVEFVVTSAARDLPAARTSLMNVRLPSMPVHRILNVISAITDLRWITLDGRIVIDGPVPNQDEGATVRTKYIIAGRPVYYVFGAAENRGISELEQESGLTILQAVARAKPRDDADLSRVSLIRPDPATPLKLEIDVLEMIRTGKTAGNFVVKDGDIVFLPPIGTRLPPLKLAVGSSLRFVLDNPEVAKAPGSEQLRLLAEPQAVGRDGTIFLPYVGPVSVLGKSQEEVSELVRSLYRPLFAFDIGGIHARVLSPR